MALGVAGGPRVTGGLTGLHVASRGCRWPHSNTQRRTARAEGKESRIRCPSSAESSSICCPNQVGPAVQVQYSEILLKRFSKNHVKNYIIERFS
jgi:hypothetical protein